MLKIGHRGASAYAPENTLAAFRKALDMGAEGIELDLHVCATGELVVIHDETLERTANGKGLVAEHSLTQLKELRTANNEQLLTLDELFAALGKEPYYFLECKVAPAMLKTAQLIMQRAEQGWDARKLVLIGFDHAAIAQARTQHPAIITGASVEEISAATLPAAKEMGAKYVLPHYRSLTQAHVTDAHALGLGIIPWTVNMPSDIARLRVLKVDGIIGDYPDRL